MKRPVGFLDGGALREIEHDLQRPLVVERQQLHRHMLGVDQPKRRKRGRADDQEKGPGAGSAFQDGPRDRDIDAADSAAFRRMAVGRAMRVASAFEFQHQPGRQNDGDEERKQHRCGCVRRDRAHIGAHHARHEEHGQQSGDHGERRDDRRIADFRDGLDGSRDARAPVAHGPMTRDILDHHDRVVDEDAYREDQREQADAIERVAHDPGGEERQQDRRGDDHGDHERLAPADRERDQHDDRNRGEPEMEQQFVGFLVRGLAIIARDRHLDVFRENLAARLFEPLYDLVGDHDRIRAGPLRDRKRNSGSAVKPACDFLDVGNAILRRRRRQIDRRDIPDINGAAVARRK